jgi:hypothetical protein
MRRLLVCLMLMTLPAAALDLKLSGFYALNRPASLEYDPDFCGLWIANEGPEIILVTLDGHELRRFSSDLGQIKAVALDGTALIVADGYGGYQRMAKDGAALAPPFRLGRIFVQTEGLVVGPDGTLILVEDDPARIVWVTDQGRVIKEIDGDLLDPAMTEPQGIARDPRSGHLLVVDDWEGSNSLFEFDADGVLLGTIPLIRYGRDPEGIAIRPGANLLFMAFDGGARIAAFDYAPTVADGVAPPKPGGDCMISGLRSARKPV